MKASIKRAPITALIIAALWPAYSHGRDFSCEDLLKKRFERALPAGSSQINLKVHVGSEDSLFFRGGAENLTSVQVRAVSGARPLVGGFFPAGNSGAMMMLASTVKEPLLKN